MRTYFINVIIIDLFDVCQLADDSIEKIRKYQKKNLKKILK